MMQNEVTAVNIKLSCEKPVGLCLRINGHLIQADSWHAKSGCITIRTGDKTIQFHQIWVASPCSAE